MTLLPLADMANIEIVTGPCPDRPVLAMKCEKLPFGSRAIKPLQANDTLGRKAASAQITFPE